MTKTSDSDKNLLKTSTGIVIDAAVQHVEDLIKIAPLLGLAYNLAKGLMGNSMERRKQRVFEFMEPIVNNPKVFTEQVLASEEFQDGFAFTLHQYIVIRNKRKRQVVRAVFEDFARSLDRSDFQLERFIDAVQKISPAAIALLGFICSSILPFRDERIHADLSTKNLGIEKSYAWWFENRKKHEPISRYISEWSEVQRSEAKIINNEELDTPVSELVTLGIANNYYSYDGWGGGGMHWTLTDFGYEFMEYVQKSD